MNAVCPAAAPPWLALVAEIGVAIGFVALLVAGLAILAFFTWNCCKQQFRRGIRESSSLPPAKYR
jgi:hypothetical protein